MSLANEAAVDLPELPPLGDTLEFMRLLWGLDHALQRLSKRMETALGVTGPQRLVIRLVGRFPGMTPSHLARLLHVHPSTLTGIMKRLERHGLVRKRADARDRRRILLGLTKKGRLIDAELPGTVETAVQIAIAHTPEEILHATRSVLSSITDALASAALGSDGG
jgi:DNA-binding MarR family transcriptional regulator